VRERVCVCVKERERESVCVCVAGGEDRDVYYKSLMGDDVSV